MALKQDILDAIDRDLPNQVGSLLKSRLQEAEDLAAENDKQSDEIERLRAEVDEQRSLDQEADALLSQRKSQEAKERELDQREAILKIKEEYADKGRADLMLIMGTVFKCPEAREYAFNLNGYANGMYNAQGMSMNPSVGLSGDAKETGA